MAAPNAGHGVARLREEVGERLLRPLATYERFRVTLHNLGFHYNVSLAGIYSPAAWHTDVRSAQLAILSSIRRAVLEHQSLGFQLRCDKKGNPWFIRLQQIRVADAVEFRQAQTENVKDDASVLKLLEKTLSEQNSSGFEDPDRPLWRVVVLSLGNPGSEGTVSPAGQLVIIFVYHHVIADGMSGFSMHNSILNGLESRQNYEVGDAGEVDYTVTPLSAPLLPSMDELVAYKMTWKERAASRFRSWAPCLRKDFGLKKWAGDPYYLDSSSTTKTNIRLIRLTADETVRIQDICRVENVSVTALLQVLVASVLFDTFQDAGVLRCATAISLRRFFPPEARIDGAKMGLWIDGFTDTFTRQELVRKPASSNQLDVSWMQARRSKEHIQAEIKKGLYDLGFASLRGVHDFRSALESKLGHDRANSYSIVSLGVFERTFPAHQAQAHRTQGPSSADDWSLEGMIVSQSAHVNGSAIQFCTAATDRGGMTISAGWQDRIVPQDDVEYIVDRLREKLERLSF